MFHCLPFFISHKLSPINLYFSFATLFYPIFSFASIVFVSLFLNTYFLNDQYFLSSIFFSFLRHSVLLLVPLPFSSIYPSFSLFIILPFIYYIILLITFYGQYKNPSYLLEKISWLYLFPVPPNFALENYLTCTE